MTKYVLVIVTALMTALGCMAQEGTVDRYQLSYINMSTGMPNNFTDDIYEDSQGFVWVSTHGGGLVRYDGFNFVNFGLGGSVIKLRSNSCRNVCEDSFKRLWIAFEEGPQVLDLTTMHPVTPPCENKILQTKLNKALRDLCTRMYADTKGNMWMISPTRLYRFAFNAEGVVRSVLSVPFPSNAPDLGICDVFRRGTVVLCNNGKVKEFYANGNRMMSKDLTAMFAPLGNRYADGIIYYNNKVWLATNQGLFNSGGEQYHCTSGDHSLQHELVTSLAVAPDDKLLVGTLCGVDIIDRTGRMEHWNACNTMNPLSSNFVNCIFSKHGQIWVGTETGGITKLTPRQLQLDFYRNIPSDPSSLSPNAVNAMYAAPDGNLWVGTVEGGLNLQSFGSNCFIHFTTSNSGLPHNSVSTIAPDNRGNLWIGTWGLGVAVMPLSHPGRITRVAGGERLLNFVGSMVYDAVNDGVWIGTNDGLFFFDMKAKRLLHPFKGCLNVRGCIGSLVTKDHKLFMGCVKGMIEVELSRRNGDGTFPVHYHPYKLDNPGSGVIDKIISFCQSHDGKIWMGSNGYGLYCYNYDKDGHRRVKSYTTSDGLSNNTVKGIVEDRQGMLWVATDNGLSIFNPRTETFSNFSEKDGLLNAQFYFNGAICSPSGRIYLGTKSGLIAVKGLNQSTLYTGNLHFTELSVDNQPVVAGSYYIDKDISIAKEMKIHESDKSFTISFSALNYMSETQGVYRYRMRGYENDWVQLEPGQHSVRYSTLPAGDYEFEVKYAPSVHSDKEQRISIGVSVIPYFWKSWWFVTFMIVGFVVLLQYAYLRRLRIMREREAEELYRPIEAALKDSAEPGKLQSRIQTILENQKRYQESQQKTIEADKKEVTEKVKPFMQELMEVMEENYGNPEFGVQELADAMHISRSQLSKKITSESGLPPTQFIRNYRLDIAKKMLAENVANRNITEIAYRVGFNDPKYFTRCFTKLYGMSPSSYKGRQN